MVFKRSKTSNILISVQKESLNRIQTNLAQLGKLYDFEGLKWHYIEEIPTKQMMNLLTEIFLIYEIRANEEEMKTAVESANGNLRYLFELGRELKRSNIEEFTENHAAAIPKGYLRLILNVLTNNFSDEDGKFLSPQKQKQIIMMQFIASTLSQYVPRQILESLSEVFDEKTSIPIDFLNIDENFCRLPHGGYELILLYPDSLVDRYLEEKEEAPISSRVLEFLIEIRRNLDNVDVDEIALTAFKQILVNPLSCSPIVWRWIAHYCVVFIGNIEGFISMFPAHFWDKNTVPSWFTDLSEHEQVNILDMLGNWVDLSPSVKDKLIAAEIFINLPIPQKLDNIYLLILPRIAFILVNEKNVAILRHYIDTALEKAGRTNITPHALYGLITLAAVYVGAGDIEIGKKVLEIANSYHKQSKNKELLIEKEFLQCKILVYSEKWEEAYKSAKKGLKISKKEKNRKQESNFLHELSMIVERLTQDPEQGLKYLDEAIEICREIDDFSGLYQSLGVKGDLCSFLTAKYRGENELSISRKWGIETVKCYSESYFFFKIHGMVHRAEDYLNRIILVISIRTMDDQLGKVKSSLIELYNDVGGNELERTILVLEYIECMLNNSKELAEEKIKKAKKLVTDDPFLNDAISVAEAIFDDSKQHINHDNERISEFLETFPPLGIQERPLEPRAKIHINKRHLEEINKVLKSSLNKNEKILRLLQLNVSKSKIASLLNVDIDRINSVKP